MRHIAVSAVGLVICLGVPFLFFAKGLTVSPDAVSSATQIITDSPSGDFVIYLNSDRSPETLADWTTFFQGGDGGVIMEDLNCLVCSGDSAALEMARVYQSRLPENQMTIRSEDTLMTITLVESGHFDAAVFTDEIVSSRKVSIGDTVTVIRISGSE
ncbi:MAG: hypothetical protein IJ251_07330 [Oscillospiraceae bacterium]|nr:hypothetical protein [Oscillospiraceae bacterium]